MRLRCPPTQGERERPETDHGGIALREPVTARTYVPDMHDEIERLQIEIATRSGYELVDHALNLYGKCMDLVKSGQCARARPQKPTA